MVLSNIEIFVGNYNCVMFLTDLINYNYLNVVHKYQIRILVVRGLQPSSVCLLEPIHFYEKLHLNPHRSRHTHDQIC